MKKKAVSITLDEDTIEKVKKYSEMNSRTFSNSVNFILWNFIKLGEGIRRTSEIKP